MQKCFVVIIKPREDRSLPSMMATRHSMDEAMHLARVYCREFIATITETDIRAIPLRVVRTWDVEPDGKVVEI